MNYIVITSIICLSVVFIVIIYCYTNYKLDENVKSNSFYKTYNTILKQNKTTLDEISNLKCLLNTIQQAIEFLSMQISYKENKDE